MTKPLKYGLTIALLIAGWQFFVFTVLFYSFNVYQLTRLAEISLIALISLINAALITIFIFSSSQIFRDFLTTFRQLLRFESLSHPLLIKLSLEAPGTYFHTISTTNLAYQATKAIKGNGLLVRAGGYYHDIGKLKKPSNFTENQLPGQNSLENISPKRAAGAIINHIKDGVELAEKYNLPEEVIDFIPQHQGTTLVSYFYTKAKEKRLHPLRRDFRYPGPKPISREAAILMLADSLEAASRAIDQPSPEKIAALVQRIIQQKIDDNQLTNCGLVEKDLKIIEQNFIQTLTSMLAQRISYPNDSSPFFQFDPSKSDGNTDSAANSPASAEK